jgi:hypothetical protein
VENLVPERKKNGEIILCVDFINLNKCYLKDNYPLPNMDNILQRVVGASRIYMMDWFFGYNQVTMHLEETDKTTFITPSGTFMYKKMPFGIINAGAMFQRERNISFVGEKYRFIIINLEDTTILSKYDQDHLKHLRKTFIKCINMASH